jgi:lipopolysaccharide cholinephosphotransferase
LLKEITAQEREDLQACLFNAYLDIKQVCEKYGFSLFLVEGSAIGAVRHKGFIPWDDDIDVAMMREDYEQFKDIFDKELGTKYILNAPNFSNNARDRYPIVLIKDSYYERLIDTKDASLHKVPIDIFIVDNVPNNKIIRKFKGLYCDFLEFIAGQVYLRETTNQNVKDYLCVNGKTVYNIRMILGFLFSFHAASRWFDIIDKAIQHKNENSKECGILTARGHYFGEILPREAVLPASEGICNGEIVQLYHDTDLYLRKLYGNYMEIPPVEKRERHFFCDLKLPEKQV